MSTNDPHPTVTPDEARRLRSELAEARADSVLLRDRLSALHQDLASERLRYQHEATKHREWSDRWHELVHALVEQQGGSAIVYDLTPAQREAHVGRSIGVRPMPVCGATRYVLEEREASDVR